ncbi:MAG: ABC1 kinase family protein [Candidatus Nanohaloarchaea archaeon]
MGVIEKEIGDVKRFDEIMRTLAEAEMGIIAHRLNLSHRLPGLKKFRVSKDRPAPERVREVFEELGPTFIKFGQILAQRPDLLPEEYTEELEKLEDEVPAFPPDRAKQIIDEEIGLERFAEIKDEPVAAASIAQVHEGRLENGDRVAIKVRRPGIKEQIEKDLDILRFLARRGEKHVEKLKDVRIEKVVEKFGSWTQEEMNLEREGRNADVLRENLEDEEKIKIPEIHMDLTTRKVLTMEYVEGVKSNDQEALKEMDIDKHELARTAIRAGLKQIVRDGFFHADPHPSNFLVDEEGNLVHLDFGMVGKLTKNKRKYLGLLLIHAIQEDADSALEDVKHIGTVQEDADLDGLKEEIEEKILLIRNTTLEEHSITRQLLDITVTATEKGVYMPTSFVIMGKSLVTMEGIGLRLYPDFQITDELKPTVKRILIEEYSPENMFEDFAVDMMENADLIEELPSKLNQLADQKEQQVKVVNENTDSPQLTVVAALIIASSILLLQSLTPDLALLVALLEMAAAVIYYELHH